MRASSERCPHPRAKQRTTTQGFTECKRCGADTSPPQRHRSWRISPRVELNVGDRVSIGNDGRARDKGTFYYAEITPSTGAVSIAVLTHEHTEKGEPVGAGWRFVRPERVRRA